MHPSGYFLADPTASSPAAPLLGLRPCVLPDPRAGGLWVCCPGQDLVLRKSKSPQQLSAWEQPQKARRWLVLLWAQPPAQPTPSPREGGRAMAGRADCWPIKPAHPCLPLGTTSRLSHYVFVSADHPPKAVLPLNSLGYNCLDPPGAWPPCLHRHSRPPPPSPGGSGPELTLSSRHSRDWSPPMAGPRPSKARRVIISSDAWSWTREEQAGPFGQPCGSRVRFDPCWSSTIQAPSPLVTGADPLLLIHGPGAGCGL